MYIDDPRNRIVNDNERINIVLSFMEGSSVNDWIQNLYDASYDEQNRGWQCSWQEFIEELNEAFLDSQREEKACQELETMRQRPNEAADDFFKCFEVVLNITKYDKNSHYVLDRIERAVNTRIIDQIVSSRVEPVTTYQEWKKLIISVDEMWRCQNEKKRAWGFFGNRREEAVHETAKPQTATAPIRA